MALEKEDDDLTDSELSARDDALYAEAAEEDMRRAAAWQHEQEDFDYDGLPYTQTLERYREEPPVLPEPLIGGILRNMDANLEEAATILQTSRAKIIRKITLPIVRPAMLSTFLLVFASSMSAYTVPV